MSPRPKSGTEDYAKYNDNYGNVNYVLLMF